MATNTAHNKRPVKKQLLSVGLVMSKSVSTLQRSATANDAIRLLWARRIRNIPILDGKKLIGIVTDRDIKQMLSADEDPDIKGKFTFRLPKLTVEDIMTPEPYTVTPNDPLRLAADLMGREKVGGLPVLDRDERLVGIITESDMLAVCATLLEFLEPGEDCE